MPIECKKIVVIGAGVAGLQAARQLLAAGYSVLVLEASEDVGGVWRQNYQGFGLQGAGAACGTGSRPRAMERRQS